MISSSSGTSKKDGALVHYILTEMILKSEFAYCWKQEQALRNAPVCQPYAT
jgi:hypothetical protein